MSTRSPIYALCCLMLLLMSLAQVQAATTLRLEDLDISQSSQSLGAPQRDKSVDGNAIRIGSQTYTHGLGTHAEFNFQINLGGNASQFTSSVGVDTETGTNGSVEFIVITDDTIAWRSGVMKGGAEAKALTVNLTGVQKMRFIVTTADDGYGYDHADWANPIITVTGNASAIVPTQDAPVILTPPAPATPRINGARVFGVRPNSPFLFTVPATGNRPMTFSAIGLPAGLSLNSSNGQITGKLTQAGTHNVTLVATNSLGEDRKNLRIVCGNALALTPPMGWNSYNYLNANATEQIMRAVADAFVSKDLINYGWTYINTDFGWNSGEHIDPITLALQPDPTKYQNFKGMCDYIHSRGLKVGLYSTPWEVGYSGFIGESTDNPNRTGYSLGGKVGPYTFETVDVAQWVEWGVDFMKYDWCPIDIPSTERMSNALKAAPRDIVYSLSNAATFSLASQYAQLAQCWRTTGDINDSWYSVSSNGFGVDPWRPYAGPGHWNDPDMMEIGHPKLTPNEQYTHMSLWCLVCSPLLLGFDVTKADDFTLSLLRNDEVLEVNQDPLGQQAARLVYGGDIEVWAKDMSDGSKAVGIFNRGYVNAPGSVNWSALGISGSWSVRDLWRQQDIGTYSSSVSFNVPWHGCYLFRVFPTSQTTHAITASAGSGGTINPSGNVTVYHEADQTFSIIPNAGYKISNVTVDGVGVGAVTSYTFSDVIANHTISATFADATTCGITASAGTGGTISPSGTVRVKLGANQTFIMTPSTGYAVANVRVDGRDLGAMPSYTFTNATVDHTISVEFIGTMTRFEAEASANTLTGGCNRRSDGTWWTGAGFVGNLGNSASNKLTFNGVTVPTAGNYTIAMRYMTWGTRTVHISVNGVGDYVMSCPEGSGTNINIASKTLPLAAGANSIAMWNPTGWAPDIDYIALPNEIYTITASAGSGGSISPTGSVVVVAGTDKTFTMTPDTGNAVANVTVDGMSRGALSSYTFSGISAAHTITATFALAAEDVASIAALKGKPAGALVRLIGNESVIYAPKDAEGARTTKFFYIGEAEARGGLKVTEAVIDGLSLGNKVAHLIGYVRKPEGKEISLELVGGPVANGNAPIAPVGINNRSALTDAGVLTNAVTVWGQIKTITDDNTSFTISDGYDDSGVTVTVNGVALPGGFGVTKPVVVTGLITKDDLGRVVILAQDIRIM